MEFLQAPPGERIRFRFFGEFGLYCKNGACYDWVEIRFNGLLNNTGPRYITPLYTNTRWAKNGTIFVHLIISPNLNRLLKFFYCQE